MDAKHASQEARQAGQRLEVRVARLELATSALWGVLRDQFGLSDSEIVDRMREVDLADGKRDGKQVRPPVECPQCGRTTSAIRPLCIYCGAEVENGG